MERAKEFEKFLNETLRPDYLKTVESREKTLVERNDYEILLVTVQKIQVGVVLLPLSSSALQSLPYGK